MTPEELVHHVANLATRVRDGEPVAAELVTAARDLRHQFDTARNARSSLARYPAAETGMDIAVDDAADWATQRDTQMGEATNWITRREHGFVATTAGQLRRIFPASPKEDTEFSLSAHCLNTLPTPLPADDNAQVVVYASGIPVSYLLWETSQHEDTTSAVQRLIDRVVNKHPLPWEDPYSRD